MVELCGFLLLQISLCEVCHFSSVLAKQAALLWLWCVHVKIWGRSFQREELGKTVLGEIKITLKLT